MPELIPLQLEAQLRTRLVNGTLGSTILALQSGKHLTRYAAKAFSPASEVAGCLSY